LVLSVLKYVFFSGVGPSVAVLGAELPGWETSPEPTPRAIGRAREAYGEANRLDGRVRELM
jgi:hypothetical protein